MVATLLVALALAQGPSAIEAKLTGVWSVVMTTPDGQQRETIYEFKAEGGKLTPQYEGSYGHEEQDARAYAAWGVDYLKYDWCSARVIYSTAEEQRAAYQKMAVALQKTGRPIVYARWKSATGA